MRGSRTTRLRFLCPAAKIWCHGGRVGVSYSDHAEEKGIFQRLMDRLRAITKDDNGFALYRWPCAADRLSCMIFYAQQTKQLQQLTTSGEGRQRSSRLKKTVATETHRTATGAICVHNLI